MPEGSEQEYRRITLDRDDIEIVEKFPYLGNVLSTKADVQETMTSRISSGWKKFTISDVLCKKGIYLIKD